MVEKSGLSTPTGKQRVLVVGLGTMGTSHARAYKAIEGFDLVGLCTRNAAARARSRRGISRRCRASTIFGDALAALKPDAVAICAYTEHHAPMALQALAAGAHVFCEKPLADTLAAAESIVAAARAAARRLLVGYILRVHPSWTRFVEIGRTLGKPLVMRMNLNQQSSGSFWQVHKKLMRSTSPIVDCGVHYVDIMCQVTRARPVAVHAVGARLTDEIAPAMYNYGHLHIVFDGRLGRLVRGRLGADDQRDRLLRQRHDRAERLRVDRRPGGAGRRRAVRRPQHAHAHQRAAHPSRGAGRRRRFAKPDEIVSTEDEPGHQELCEREQRLFLKAIRGEVDLTEHHEDALNSLRIVFAADESVRTGEVVRL